MEGSNKIPTGAAPPDALVLLVFTPRRETTRIGNHYHSFETDVMIEIRSA